MPKRFFLTLIALLAISAGLYQLRIQILTSAFNVSLAKADIHLVQMEGLELGWQGVDINRMVLGAGKGETQHTFHGVHLSYSIVNAQPQSLTVRQAVLSLPVSEDDQGSSTPLLLTDILDQIMASPLQSVTVDVLELEGFSSQVLRLPIGLRLNWEESSFRLEAEDRASKLLIELGRSTPDNYELKVTLLRSDEPAMEFEAAIEQHGKRQHIEGGGRLNIDTALPLLTKLMALPDPVKSVSGELLYKLSGEMADELGELEGQSWELQVLPQSILELALVNAVAEGNLQLEFLQALSVSMQPGGPGGSILSVTGEAIGWQLDEKLNAINAAGRMSGIQCRYQATLACEVAMELKSSVPQFTVSGEDPLHIKNLALGGSMQLTLAEERLSAMLASGEWLRAESLTQGDILVQDPALVAASSGQLEYHLSTGGLSLLVDKMQILLPRVQMPDLTAATLLSLKAVQLSQDASGIISTNAHVSADAVNLERHDTWLPALAFDLDVALKDQNLEIQGQVRGGGQIPLLKIAAAHQLDTQGGSARVQAENIIFNGDSKRLSQHFSYWPFEWDIYEGALTLDVGLEWRKDGADAEIQANIKQRMQGLSGVYKDIGFVGLDSNFVANYYSPGQLLSTSAATISLDSLDVGVPIKNIRSRFLLDLAQQKLTLELVEAELFGGRVWIDEAVYRADKPHNPIFVGVDGIQLDQLLELAGYDAVQATGTISGLLPIDVNEAGITMERGMLAAKAPGGVFRYHTEIVAGTNPAMVQVIEALKNYQYSVFQVEADYLENGDLILAMILRGSNPELQQGRPIHLNLNVTDNIPTLLKSLQSGRVIADKVGKKLGQGPK